MRVHPSVRRITTYAELRKTAETIPQPQMRPVLHKLYDVGREILAGAQNAHVSEYLVQPDQVPPGVFTRTMCVHFLNMLVVDMLDFMTQTRDFEPYSVWVMQLSGRWLWQKPINEDLRHVVDHSIAMFDLFGQRIGIDLTAPQFAISNGAEVNCLIGEASLVEQFFRDWFAEANIEKLNFRDDKPFSWELIKMYCRPQ